MQNKALEIQYSFDLVKKLDDHLEIDKQKQKSKYASGDNCCSFVNKNELLTNVQT